MKKYILNIILIALVSNNIFSQTSYFTKSGKIDFFSKTAVENNEASNNQVVSTLKTETGELNFGVLIKSFKFKNALMEEHFNENYMESTKFPKATFKGKITNITAINFGKNGTYTANVTGELMIHGVTKEISTTAQIEVKDKTFNAVSSIIVKPADYNIQIPELVREKIAKDVSIDININYEVYNK